MNSTKVTEIWRKERKGELEWGKEGDTNGQGWNTKKTNKNNNKQKQHDSIGESWFTILSL